MSLLFDQVIRINHFTVFGLIPSSHILLSLAIYCLSYLKD